MFPDATAATTKTLAAGTTAVNSASIDLLADSDVNIVIDLGAITATGVGSFQLQRSDNNSTWANITGAVYSFTDADSNKTVTIALSELTNRYIRVVTTRTVANTAIAGMKAYASPRGVAVTQVTTANQNAAVVVVAGSYL